MEDILCIVAEYLYTKTRLAIRISAKVYYDKIHLNDILLHKYRERIRGQSFLNKKYSLKSILYPYRLVRQTNDPYKKVHVDRFIPYQVLDSWRRGPEELYKIDYNPLHNMTEFHSTNHITNMN